jgi:hypothetical protein
MQPAAEKPAARSKGPDVVKRRKRIQRVYTTVAVVVSTCSVAYAIDMNASADQGQAAKAKTAKWRSYVGVLDKHVTTTQGQYDDLLGEYRKVIRDARKQQVRMLADLSRARAAARKAKSVNLAPTVYSSSVSFSAAPSVSAAAPAAPSSGTS